LSFFRSREFVLLGLLIALLVFASIVEPRFVAPRAQFMFATHLWELALVAVPMLLIIMIGGIDLSVGAMVAFSAVTLGLAYERGFQPFVAAGLAILAGTALGFANGWFVAKLRVHPLIVTLATMAAYRGIAEGISLARPISGFPQPFLSISQGSVAGISIPMIAFTVFAFLAWLVLAKFRLGRWIVAIGTGETAAEYSGIPVGRVKVALYTLSGLVCGIAATLLVARNNTAKADLGSGWELEAITAVVLGGASIEGGKGRVLGLVLGLLLIHETRTFVSLHWKRSELDLIVLGTLLIGALLFERLISIQRRKAAVPA